MRLDPYLQRALKQVLGSRHGLVNRLQIPNKDGLYVPMGTKPYHEQMAFAKAYDKFDSILVLKARQCGLTTINAALGFDRIYRAKGPRRLLMMADTAETNQAQWGKITGFNKRLPEFLRKETERSNRKELIFRDSGAGIRVVTAGGSNPGTGWTFQDLFLDELGKWNESFAEEVYGSVTSAQFKTAGSKTIIASTPTGPGTLFHRKVVAALEARRKGDRSMEFLFFPWFLNPDYRREVPLNWEPPQDMYASMVNLGLDLTVEQLYWKWWKIHDPVDGIGAKHFKRDYPETEEDGFLVLTGSWFDQDYLNEVCFGLGHADDELRIYHPPEPGVVYCAGIDGAWCNGGDDAVVQILDSTGRQCAVFSTNQGGEIRFAQMASELLAVYKKPLTLVEGNKGGAGLNILRILQGDGHKVWLAEPLKLGGTPKYFYTTAKTKMQVYAHLRQEVNADVLELNDRSTVTQLMHIREENGTIEGRDGLKDDESMALALANWCRQRIKGKGKEMPRATAPNGGDYAFMQSMKARHKKARKSWTG